MRMNCNLNVTHSKPWIKKLTLSDKTGKNISSFPKEGNLICIQSAIKGKVLQHLKYIYIWPKDFSCLFITDWKKYAQERCGVSLYLRGKTPQQSGPGDFKTYDGQQD